MRCAPTPAWTLILVPPTPKAATRRVGVRMRTARRAAALMIMLLAPVIAMPWVWMDRHASTATTMADRLAAQERTMAMLTDSLDSYRRLVLADRAAKSPPSEMIMPVAGRVTSWFSRSRLHPILRVFRPHRGIDVAASAGTRIVAPATATVKFVGRKLGFGLVVELVHSGGVVTRYAHCRSALVQRGDRVVAGQTIATVGSTGLATSPHLHFEVLVKGTAVDPVQFLAGARTRPAPSAPSAPLTPSLPSSQLSAASASRANDEE